MNSQTLVNRIRKLHVCGMLTEIPKESSAFRLTEENRQMLNANLGENGAKIQVNNKTQLFNLLVNRALTIPQTAVNNANQTEKNAQANEFAELQTKYADLMLEKSQLQTNLDELQAAPISLTLLAEKDPRLDFLLKFQEPTDKGIEDTIVNYQQRVELSIMKAIMDPLHLLSGPDYDALKKWDEEIFMPAMRTLTGIEDLELTGAEKFMMIWDYAKADSIAELLKEEELSDIVKAKIEDMQFPRSEMVQQILKSKNLINESAEPVSQETTN